jgi:hypothetical protein
MSATAFSHDGHDPNGMFSLSLSLSLSFLISFVILFGHVSCPGNDRQRKTQKMKTSLRKMPRSLLPKRGSVSSRQPRVRSRGRRPPSRMQSPRQRARQRARQRPRQRPVLEVLGDVYENGMLFAVLTLHQVMIVFAVVVVVV